MCIGKEVKSNSGQHCNAHVLGTGRAGDCTVLGLLASVTGREPPLCCGNTIQILISSCHPTLLPASRICALSPKVVRLSVGLMGPWENVLLVVSSNTHGDWVEKAIMEEEEHKEKGHP